MTWECVSCWERHPELCMVSPVPFLGYRSCVLFNRPPALCKELCMDSCGRKKEAIRKQREGAARLSGPSKQGELSRAGGGRARPPTLTIPITIHSLTPSSPRPSQNETKAFKQKVTWKRGIRQVPEGGNRGSPSLQPSPNTGAWWRNWLVLVTRRCVPSWPRKQWGGGGKEEERLRAVLTGAL